MNLPLFVPMILIVPSKTAFALGVSAALVSVLASWAVGVVGWHNLYLTCLFTLSAWVATFLCHSQRRVAEAHVVQVKNLAPLTSVNKALLYSIVPPDVYNHCRLSGYLNHKGLLTTRGVGIVAKIPDTAVMFCNVTCDDPRALRTGAPDHWFRALSTIFALLDGEVQRRYVHGTCNSQYMQKCVCILTHVCACMHVRACVQHTRARAHTQTSNPYVRTYVRTYVCVYVNIYACVCVCARAHVCVSLCLCVQRVLQISTHRHPVHCHLPPRRLALQFLGAETERF